MRCIDLFAGAGGFTEGARLAGARVVWAANHWPLAVQYHKTNHPDTWHECQDLQQADWRAVPAHDVVLASPACQGHSRARGRERPHHDALRSTAWAVVACAEYHRSPVILVENVPDFEKWVLYPAWRDALRRLGYAVSPHLVDAADHGVPQNRQRLFLVCTRSRRPLRLSLPRREHRPIADVIQWDAVARVPVHDLADAGRHRPGAGCHVPEEAPGRAEGQDAGAVVGRTASRHRGRWPECLSRHAGRLAFLTSL